MQQDGARQMVADVIAAKGRLRSRRKASAQALLAGAERASAAGSKPLPLGDVQTEVNAVRSARKGSARALPAAR